MDEIIKSQRIFFRTWIISILIFLLSILLVTGLNYWYASHNPGGKDALVHWMGTRMFLGRGIDPYGAEATSQYQEAAKELTGYDGSEELRFVSPLFIIILYVPFLFVSDFTLVRAVCMTVLEAGILLQLFYGFRLAKWKPGWISITAFIVYIFLSHHVLQSIKDCDIIILVALCLTGGIWALLQGSDELAGVLFALTSLKIHIAVIFYIVIIYWAFKQKRYKIIGWFVATLFLMSLSIALLMPGWIISNLRAAAIVLTQYPLGYLGELLSTPLPGMGMRIGWVITGILLLLLGVEWFIVSWSYSENILWTIYLTLVVSQWVGIRLDTGNFIILLPVVIYVFSLWQERWHKYGVFFTITSLFFLCLIVWLLYLSQTGDVIRQRVFTLIPEPAFLLVSLYWVKWWANRSEILWFDVISSHENRGKDPDIYR